MIHWACYSLLASASWLELLHSARPLGILVWVGVAILTVSLFVLGRTRWGQARPLSKCVVLSGFAHILLAAYAYGTHLIFDPLPRGTEQAIELTILNADEAQSLEPAPAEKQPWDEFASSQLPPAPDWNSPEQMVSQLPSIQRDGSQPLMATAVTFPGDTAPLPEVRAADAEQPGLERLRSGTATNATELAFQIAKRTTEQLAPIGPDAQQIGRQGTGQSSPPRRGRDSVLSQEELVSQTRVQQLSDLPLDEQPHSALHGEDRTKHASNEAGQAPVDTAGSQPEDDPAETDDRLVSAPLQSTEQEVGEVRAANGADSARAVIAPVEAPVRLGDGKPLPEIYHARLRPDRMEEVKRHGGSAVTEAAVDAALAWLAQAQDPDGRWRPALFEAGRETAVLGHNRDRAGARADTGISGLAILAFLGRGNTHMEGRYRKNVQRGLEFLLRSQRSDGALFGDSRLFEQMYCHGMAMLAISEAYAMTGDHRLKPFVEQAQRFTAAAQHAGGGWRYQPGDEGDMSQFGWQVMALSSAQLAGIDTPASTQDRMNRFLSRLSSGRHGGLSSYRPGEAASAAMTAEALFCRILLQHADQPAALEEATAMLLQNPPGAGKPNFYYWYYATLALFQLQGDAWDVWNHDLQTQLLSLQETRGSNAGSWPTDTVWGGYGGRVYTTALATLCLQVYYRYLPLLADSSP